MQFGGPIDMLPLPGIFAATFVLVMLSVECGWRLGRARWRQSEPEMDAPVGTMVAASLGLLAFILAFTFGMAAARFDTRRELVLEEANALGTAYLRASLLETRGGEIQDLLRTYLDVRLDAVRTGAVAEGIRQSEVLHGQLWAEAIVVARLNPESTTVSLFIQSLNEVIDLHTRRIASGIRMRIPGTIWIGLFTVASFSLGAVGYQVGLSGSRRSLAIMAVAVTFSTVIWLIADLDRPQEGSLTVSQQALVEARQGMNPTLNSGTSADQGR